MFFRFNGRKNTFHVFQIPSNPCTVWLCGVFICVFLEYSVDNLQSRLYYCIVGWRKRQAAGRKAKRLFFLDIETLVHLHQFQKWDISILLGLFPVVLVGEVYPLQKTSYRQDGNSFSSITGEVCLDYTGGKRRTEFWRAKSIYLVCCSLTKA